MTHTEYLAPDKRLERAGVTEHFSWCYASGRWRGLLSQVR